MDSELFYHGGVAVMKRNCCGGLGSLKMEEIAARRAGVSTKYPQLAKIIAEKSLKRGKFTLASGRTSDYYIDARLSSLDPAGASAIAEAILKEIEGMKVDAVGGMDMGATPIVGAVAIRSFQLGKPMPTFVVRKDVKAHGTQKLIEGPIPAAPCNVVIVDDVVTSGGSILKAIDAVEKHGGKVILAISVLDRNAGATEAMEERKIPYRPLLTLADIGIKD
jgi:orotate phosphoribosyltransferase